MTSPQADSKTLRKRERRAGERILENSALRDELNDEQANQLFEWGFAHIKEEVKRTAALPEEDAQAVIEQTTTNVSRVMYQVNRLVAALSQSDQLDEESESYMAHLISCLNALQDVTPQDYDQLALLITLDGRDAIFDALLTILKAKPAAANPTADADTA
ncbi:MAG: hypothetical protein KDE51_21040 [Anaerolineales bacterium]|nr:hypothetical protein [Anaerolineales bacterium]